MVNFLVANRWMFALRGILAIVFGVVAFLDAGAALFALIYVFAAYAVIDGILAIISSFRRERVYSQWWLLLLEGVVDIAAGVIAFLFPGLAAITLVFLIAAWAIITGLLEIAAAIRLRNEITNEWALGLTGLVSIILGVILVINPAAGMIGLVWAIAGYAIIFGILMIVLAIRAGRFVSRDQNMRINPS